MKFGHLFKQTLRDEGFPPEWVDSAISYSQLKKCIKRLTDELQQVGLDPATLSKLLKHVEDYNASTQEDDEQERPFEYILNPDSSRDNASPSRKAFHPKLLFYVNETSGEVLSAQLDDETRRKLQMLAVETGMSDLRVLDDSGSPMQSANSVDPASTMTTPSAMRAIATVIFDSVGAPEVLITSKSRVFEPPGEGQIGYLHSIPNLAGSSARPCAYLL